MSTSCPVCHPTPLLGGDRDEEQDGRRHRIRRGAGAGIADEGVRGPTAVLRDAPVRGGGDEEGDDGEEEEGSERHGTEGEGGGGDERDGGTRKKKPSEGGAADRAVGRGGANRGKQRDGGFGGNDYADDDGFGEDDDDDNDDDVGDRNDVRRCALIASLPVA